jgi:hypothetical protein
MMSDADAEGEIDVDTVGVDTTGSPVVTPDEDAVSMGATTPTAPKYPPGIVVSEALAAALSLPDDPHSSTVQYRLAEDEVGYDELQDDRVGSLVVTRGTPDMPLSARHSSEAATLGDGTAEIALSDETFVRFATIDFIVRHWHANCTTVDQWEELLFPSHGPSKRDFNTFAHCFNRSKLLGTLDEALSSISFRAEGFVVPPHGLPCIKSYFPDVARLTTSLLRTSHGLLSIDTVIGDFARLPERAAKEAAIVRADTMARTLSRQQETSLRQDAERNRLAATAEKKRIAALVLAERQSMAPPPLPTVAGAGAALASLSVNDAQALKRQRVVDLQRELRLAESDAMDDAPIADGAPPALRPSPLAPAPVDFGPHRSPAPSSRSSVRSSTRDRDSRSRSPEHTRASSRSDSPPRGRSPPPRFTCTMPRHQWHETRMGGSPGTQAHLITCEHLNQVEYTISTRVSRRERLIVLYIPEPG